MKKWEKIRNVFFASVIGLSLLLPTPINVAFADGTLETKTFTFSESINQNQQQLITIDDLGEIKEIITDDGEVTYTRNQRSIELNLSNGSVDGKQYNPYKYSTQGTGYQTSSSQSGFSYSIPYNNSSYSGTIYQNGSPYVISGVYTPADSMYVTAQTSSYYNSNGYSGYLSSYVYSGSYSPSESKYVSTGTSSYTWGTECLGTNPDGSAKTTYHSKPSLSGSQYYSSGGFSGTLYLNEYSGTHPSGVATCGTNKTTIYRYLNYYYYGGTVTKPGYDTRVYRYQGYVTKPASDTRTWRQDYSGTVYQAGYDDLYQYEVTVKYVKDVTKPEISITYDDNKISHEVTVTIKGTDSESGVKQIIMPDSSVSSNETSHYTISNNGNYTFKVEDYAGNIESETIEIRNIDNDNPNSPTIQVDSNWSNSSRIVTIKNNGDNGVAGIERIEYSLFKESDNNWSKYTAPINISSEGTTSIIARAVDKAGNISDIVTQSVKIDKTKPNLTVTPDIYGLTNTDVILTVKATDNLSGVKRIKLPNGNYVNASETTFQVGENETYIFEAEDNAGNIIEFEAVVRNIKKNVLITNKREVLLELQADDLYSGVTHMQFKNETGSWSAWESYNKSKDWTLTPVDGLKHVWVQYKDKVGNISPPVEDIIILDTTKPTISNFVINENALYTKSTSVTLTLKGTDSLTGVKEVFVSNDNQNWTKMNYAEEIPWVLNNGDGTKTVYLKISDVAGNISNVVTDTIFLDTTKPLANIVINNGDSYSATREVNLTLTYSDIPGSGIETVKVIEGDKEYILPKPTPNSPVTIPWTLDFGVVKTVSIVVVDKAGNISNIASDSITVDKLTIQDFTLEDVINPLEFNAKNPFTPKVWAFSPQPMISGGNITFSVDVKTAVDSEVVQDKVDYKVEVVGEDGYHKAFVGTMRKAGNHYTQTITIPKDAPNGAKVYAIATAQRRLLVSPYDIQTVYFPGGEDVSQKAQIGIVEGNIYDVIRFNEIK